MDDPWPFSLSKAKIGSMVQRRPFIGVQGAPMYPSYMGKVLVSQIPIICIGFIFLLASAFFLPLIGWKYVRGLCLPTLCCTFSQLLGS